ncbi:MAG: radical SAM protein [Verrucomicrobiae bacterium]|nr:radical SAM protein [Verrucomicrobiae bacterium]
MNFYRLLSIGQGIRSSRLRYAAALGADVFGVRHLFVRCDPVMACNLRCRMCHFSDRIYRREHRGRLLLPEFQRIAGMLLPRALQLVVGCAAEPTLHRDWLGFVEEGRRHRVPLLGVVSNGQRLFQQQAAALVEMGVNELTLSIHGVSKQVYEHWMPGASYEHLLALLQELKEEKKKRGVRLPSLRLNYTVNADNLEELRDFFCVFGRFDVETLQVRPVMPFGGEYRQLLTDQNFILYRKIIGELTAECHRHGVRLLANLNDPGYRKKDESDAGMESVYRYVSPERVWLPDFDWRKEGYGDYCRRRRWRRHLLLMAVDGRDKNWDVQGFGTSLKYEVQ